jgi:hypothetical protein
LWQGITNHSRSTQNREHRLQDVLKSLSRHTGCCGTCHERLQVFGSHISKGKLLNPEFYMLGQMAFSSTNRGWLEIDGDLFTPLLHRIRERLALQSGFILLLV